MNILFVGSGDITANYLADRLYREGHNISWATKEEKSLLLKKEFKGKIYREGYRTSVLNGILRLQGIDTVVFAYETYVGEDEEERESLIPALQNTLKALENHKIKHFVYLSTVELDYEQVLTPKLAEIEYGEKLCRSCQERKGLPLLILRMGMCFGRYSLDKMGYVGRTIVNALLDKPVICRCSPDSYVDLIYGEDAAVAAGNLLELDKQGTYRILSGHPVSMKELHDILEVIIKKPIQVTYLNEEKTLSREAHQEMSRKLKEETGWIPFYLIKDKGGGIIWTAVDSYKKKGQEEKSSAGKKEFKVLTFLKKYSGIKGVLEALVLFGLMLLILPFTREATDLRYVDVRLAYIAMISAMFGMKIGIFSTFLACVSYVYDLGHEGIDLTYLIYSVDTWIPFIIYGATGAVLGYMSDRKQDRIDEVEEKYGNLYERYDFLKDIHKEALEVKGRLQQQISASRESFGKVYEVTEKLNTLSPDKIFYQAVDVVSDTIGECRSAIWLVGSKDSHFARRIACSGSLGEELPNSLELDEYPLLQEGFEEENLFVNRKLKDGYPDFAASVYRGGRTVAFVALYGLAAEKYTLYYQNLFKVLVGMIENSLIRAMEYEEKRKGEIYLPDTEFLKADEFLSKVKLMEQEKEKSHHTYIQIKILNWEKEKLPELSAKVSSLIRENDFAGFDKAGNLRVLLVNASGTDLPLIQKRFAGRDMEVVLW